jgi:hypothetical protein
LVLLAYLSGLNRRLLADPEMECQINVVHPCNAFELPDLNGVEWLFRFRKRSMILHTLHLEHAPLKTSFQGCHNEFQRFDSNRLYCGVKKAEIFPATPFMSGSFKIVL